MSQIVDIIPSRIQVVENSFSCSFPSSTLGLSQAQLWDCPKLKFGTVPTNASVKILIAEYRKDSLKKTIRVVKQNESPSTHARLTDKTYAYEQILEAISTYIC